MSEFGNKEFVVWATVRSWSCFCWLYRASTSLAAKNIINLISVLAIWWCPCVESSLVLLEEGVCYDQRILLAKLLVFDLIFVFQGQICLLLLVALNFLLLHILEDPYLFLLKYLYDRKTPGLEGRNLSMSHQMERYNLHVISTHKSILETKCPGIEEEARCSWGIIKDYEFMFESFLLVYFPTKHPFYFSIAQPWCGGYPDPFVWPLVTTKHLSWCCFWKPQSLPGPLWRWKISLLVMVGHQQGQ